MTKGKKRIEATVRDYLRCSNLYTEGTHYGQYLKVDISFLWAYFFVNSKSDLQILLNLKNILIKEENNIIPFSFYLQLTRLNFNLYSKAINESELKQLEDELLSWEGDFPSYVDRCFDLSIFYSRINSRKAKYYFEKSIIEGILRHGWRKDTIVSYQLVYALEILWRNNWGTKEILKDYSKKVFDLTLRVADITDGRATWQGPYNVIGLVAKYDLKLAEEFKKKLIEKEGYHNFSNRVITAILKAKINLGFSIEVIEKEMNEYRKDYDYNGKPRADYYEQKFIVYLEIAENDLYTDEEKKYAFEKMYEIVGIIKKQEIDYYLRDIDFKDEKLRYKKLCEQYNEQFNLEFDENENNAIAPAKKKRNISEEDFIKDVRDCSTKRQLIGKYKKLDNYHNGIILSNFESWRSLIEKTFNITGDIKIFVDYLEKNYFPHTDFFTSNSKYFHLGVAAALKNINTRQEILNYLFQNSGHGGFNNIMKVYEVLDDKDMCLTLFNRYQKICDLIVN